MTVSAHRVASTEALSLITQISPPAWRVISVHGAARVGSDHTELHPQPLPPVEHFQVAAATMAHEIVRIAIESEIQGRAASGIITDMVDEWCLTWPHNWPRPRPVPSPEPGPCPDEASLPESRLAQTGRMIGALVLASVGSRLGGGELRNTLLAGAQILSDVALSH